MDERKCLACGCTRFEGITLDTGEGALTNVYGLVCVNCGRVELYADSTTMEHVRRTDQAKQRIENEVKIRQDQIDELEKQVAPLKDKINVGNEKIKELEIATNNDEITVKQQKELLNAANIIKEDNAAIMKSIAELEKKIERLDREIQGYKSIRKFR